MLFSTVRLLGKLPGAMILVCAVSCVVASGAENSFPKGFDPFTTNSVLTISIEAAPEHIASLRAHPRRDVPVRIRTAGHDFSQVALQLKGNLSFRPIDDKPGFTLKFDKLLPDQRFFGQRRIHLNNSVEDPSYLHEQIGGELFRAAKIPAPRTAYAQVTLNGRKLGLYLLKEGLTEEFLSHWFSDPKGNLYDNDQGKDVDQELDRDSGKGPNTQADRQALAAAAREPDLARRWQRLGTALDRERFCTFMAMEVLIGHRDGYSLARNNYRLYADPKSGQMVFIPHGMDQLFGNPELTISPRMSGIVAAAVMETPEGCQHYRAELTRLHSQVFRVTTLQARVDELTALIRLQLGFQERREFDTAVATLKHRIQERHTAVQRMLIEPEKSPLIVPPDGIPLSAWRPMDMPAKGRMGIVTNRQGHPALWVQAGPITSASWRTNLLLAPGWYRFTGTIQTERVQPLPFGKRHGASFRVAGLSAAHVGQLTGSHLSTNLCLEFQVKIPREVELTCELRASQGQAWFDLETLRLARHERLETAP